jgi:hypothetical protein
LSFSNTTIFAYPVSREKSMFVGRKPPFSGLASSLSVAAK